MNAAATLMLELLARGARLRMAGDRLQFSPRSSVTGDLLERLRAHKGDLLAIVKATGGDTYQVEERSAIHQFDAGIPRSSAERLAMFADGDFSYGTRCDHGRKRFELFAGYRDERLRRPSVRSASRTVGDAQGLGSQAGRSGKEER